MKKKIKVKEPVVVMTASGEKAKLWGVYQFPKIWKSENGTLYLRVNVAQDTHGGIGVHEPGIYYKSDDQGENWYNVKPNQVDFFPEIVEMNDDAQIAIERRITENVYEHYGQIRIKELGIKPLWTNMMSINKVGIFNVFRYGDLPESERKFEFMIKNSPTSSWKKEYGVLDFPELLETAIVKSRLTQKDNDWIDIEPVIRRVIPERVICTPDGTLLSTISGQSPKYKNRFTNLYCIASIDKGKTWKYRGTIADQIEVSKYGYSGREDSLAIAPNGDLVCAIRTNMCGLDDSGSLATVLSRSSDGGATWSKPEPIAPTSVTPHIVKLDNEVLALVYGRPGVHAIFSRDSGKTWENPIRIVGSTYEELKKRADAEGKFSMMYIWEKGHESCANTSVVKTGSNSFLIAYSDFKYKNKDNIDVKAIKVQEIFLT